MCYKYRESRDMKYNVSTIVHSTVQKSWLTFLVVYYHLLVAKKVYDRLNYF